MHHQEPMILQLSEILKAVIPNALQGDIDILSQILIELANGNVSESEVKSRITQSHSLKEITNFLSGRELRLQSKLISFGENGNTGDIGIKDIVGNNKIELNFNINYSERKPARPKLLNRSRRAARQVQLFLKGDFGSFTEERKAATIVTLAALLGVSPDEIDVLRVYEGSIVLELKMSEEIVDQLLLIAEKRPIDLVNLGITKIHVESITTEPDREDAKIGIFNLTDATKIHTSSILEAGTLINQPDNQVNRDALTLDDRMLFERKLAEEQQAIEADMDNIRRKSMSSFRSFLLQLAYRTGTTIDEILDKLLESFGIDK